MKLARQLAKLDRMCTDRVRLYQGLVERGRMQLTDASAKQLEVEDLRRSFAWFVANHDWIKAEYERRKQSAETVAGMQAAAHDPLVMGLLEQLPDGTPVKISKRPPIAPPDAADTDSNHEDAA